MPDNNRNNIFSSLVRLNLETKIDEEIDDGYSSCTEKNEGRQSKNITVRSPGLKPQVFDFKGVNIDYLFMNDVNKWN